MNELKAFREEFIKEASLRLDINIDEENLQIALDIFNSAFDSYDIKRGCLKIGLEEVKVVWRELEDF